MDLEQDKVFALDDILKEYRDDNSEADAESYQIPEQPSAPKRSSLPTEDEVRAYLASYARGEAEPSFSERPKAGPEEPDFDSRFLMGSDREERRSTLRYGSHVVDSRPEAGYRPPRSDSYIATHTPDEDDEQPDEPVKMSFVQKIKDRMERQRIERSEKESRRRAPEKKPNYPEPKELILPGEEPAVEDEPELEPEPVEPPKEPVIEQEDSPDAIAAAIAAKLTAEEAPAAPSDAGPVPEQSAFTPSWSRGAATHKAYASMFPDTSASPAIYAEKPEEDENSDLKEAGIPLKPDQFFPANFKEYLTSLLTTAFYGLRKGAETILTAEEDDEDLGSEATPGAASKYYGRFIRSLRLRLRVSAVLLAIMAWISLGLPVFGQMANVRVAALFCLAVQGAIMLLCQDVLTGGVLNAVRRHFGADSMAVLACLLTGLDALLVGSGKLAAPHMPLCLISSLSLTGVLLSSLLTCRGLRKSLRVPSIAKRAYTVTGEDSLEDRGTTILKSQRAYTGFVRRSEEAPPDETSFQKLSIPLLLLCLLLTLVTMVVTRNLRDFVYILSVLVCAAVPFGALLCFALPYFTGAFRIFPSGAAIAGWSGLCDIGQSKNLIITDRDLFPDGTVEIEQVRIFADAKPERIISYAGSMLTACGSSVSSCFGELMERNHCSMRQIENFEYLPGGGMRGVIDSSVILCGSSDLMQLMNVRIPFRLVTPTSILLAVDGVLYGIFNMKYTADPAVRRALMGLMRSTRHPIFAIRDFNVTPVMLHDTFDVATDGYDFPPYVERFSISSASPAENSKVAAVVCRDGLGPLSNMAKTGRRMYVATRTNLYIAMAGAVLGVLLCFIRLLSAGGVSVLFLLMISLLFTIPILMIGSTLSLE